MIVTSKEPYEAPPVRCDTGDEDCKSDTYCSNCGDPFDEDAQNAALRLPFRKWRLCPNPSSGQPLVDCGIGGHMYDSITPKLP